MLEKQMLYFSEFLRVLSSTLLNRRPRSSRLIVGDDGRRSSFPVVLVSLSDCGRQKGKRHSEMMTKAQQRSGVRTRRG